MKKCLSVITAVVAASLSLSAYADLKVGIVDMNQVLQKSPLMVGMNEKLTQKFKPRQDEINDAQKQLQDETAKFNLNSNMMNAEERNALQEKTIADKANVDILTASFQRDLNIAKNQDLQTFTNQLASVINKIAEDGHYDLIEQQTNMVYVNKKLDITEQVIQQLK
jgi:outer membrane protein